MGTPTFDPLTFTIPVAITTDMVMWLVWLLVGLVGLTAFVVTYHMYSFTLSGTRTTLLLLVHYAMSAVCLIAVIAAAYLFGI
ncbi:MAG: hypothetical protein Q8P93_02695 [bacterium]|nr:hypothetical protein [bacterium]